ncbi:HNH endonuclease signature motif containing protein [Facklamia sp. P12955]|uniref:HNH endonuclease signature motif containing protein n=1 Tax=Facklamia sp. P12955 TaxID=3421946 RepID=UPI003D185E0A
MWLWEKEHGPVPKGSVIIFIDQDKSNISLDNLMCISRKSLSKINSRNKLTDNKEINKSILLTEETLAKISEK